MFERLRTFVSALSTGDAGERIAARYLRALPGWRLVARNWRNPRDLREEIDLVACDGDVLVFVEVKTRAEGARLTGYHAVDRRKKAALRRAVKAYVAGLRVKPRTVRFDIVEVSLPADPRRAPGVLHFANIPLLGPGWRP
jgi:putative endonuclease